VIAVDAYLPGCPPPAARIGEVLTRLLDELDTRHGDDCLVATGSSGQPGGGQESGPDAGQAANQAAGYGTGRGDSHA
jgi:coenzyme F420-reducing hydrogenase gamma subunit